MKKLFLSLGGIALLAGAGVMAIPLIRNDGDRTPVMVAPPDDPPEGLFDFPKPRYSSIAVRLELPVEALAEAANRNAPKVFEGVDQSNFHQRIRNGNVQWKMLPGQIALRNTGQNLAFSLPVNGAAAVSGEVDAFVLTLPIQGTVDLGGHVIGTVKPQITTDWVIEPNLNPELILNRANLTINPIGTITATKMIQDLVNPMIQKEAANVGPSIMEGLDIRKNLQRFWDEGHRSDQVSTNPPAWFIFDPKFVSMGPMDYSNPDFLAVTMGMDAQSYVSSFPANAAYPEPLPPLDLALTDPVNDLNVPVIMDIVGLNKKLAEQSFTQKFGLGGTATITSPEIRVGRKGFLLLGVSIDADTGRFGRGFTGRIWIEVKPEYDPETQTIRLEEVGFTRKTRRALPGPAAATIESMVVKSLEKDLQAEMNRYLPGANKEIQKWLNSDSIPDDVSVSIPDPDIYIVDFYTVSRTAEGAPLSPGIVLVLGAKGDIIVRMKSL